MVVKLCWCVFKYVSIQAENPLEVDYDHDVGIVGYAGRGQIRGFKPRSRQK